MYIEFKKYRKNNRIIKNILIILGFQLIFYSCNFIKKIAGPGENNKAEFEVNWDNKSEKTNQKKYDYEKYNSVVIQNDNERADANGKILEEFVNRGRDDRYVLYSHQFGVELEGTECIELLIEIDQWLGTPYRYGKKEKQVGSDCSGFVTSVYKNVYGAELSRSSHDIYKDVTPVGRDELQAGDILFFKIRGNNISHVGVFIAGTKFAHASIYRGVVIDDLEDEYYDKHFFSGGRLE
ncbi:MAG: hypothetical protein A2W91_04380 [Bacteroidetes bacterium GWF2_38_335]|nr:MAG: hypothetical protein A2W91_04380 [Bacteroidetes bacterium GWF2_38_335]